VNLRLTAIGARPKIGFPKLSGTAADARTGTREIHLDDVARATTCAVYRRERLTPAHTIEGPAVIEEYASTTVLFPGDAVRVAETGELIVTVRRSRS
jgi:N-methylhydantoinase A